MKENKKWCVYKKWCNIERIILQMCLLKENEGWYEKSSGNERWYEKSSEKENWIKMYDKLKKYISKRWMKYSR